MKLRQFITILTLIAVAAGHLAAGGQEEAPTEDGPVTITYYLWDDPTYLSIVEAFNAGQDEIFVQAEIIPADDYTTKMATLLAAGGEVD
ncbi:MAG: sugar ABC transporter substrate-binding protein, partial [Spirochaetales bacterium]|nr:sugar ABC transporter substrate-binding protein [Spirochaetales bacterium]